MSVTLCDFDVKDILLTGILALHTHTRGLGMCNVKLTTSIEVNYTMSNTMSCLRGEKKEREKEEGGKRKEGGGGGRGRGRVKGRKRRGRGKGRCLCGIMEFAEVVILLLHKFCL